MRKNKSLTDQASPMIELQAPLIDEQTEMIEVVEAIETAETVETAETIQTRPATSSVISAVSVTSTESDFSIRSLPAAILTSLPSNSEASVSSSFKAYLASHGLSGL